MTEQTTDVEETKKAGPKEVLCEYTYLPPTENGECPVHGGDACLNKSLYTREQYEKVREVIAKLERERDKAERRYRSAASDAAGYKQDLHECRTRHRTLVEAADEYLSAATEYMEMMYERLPERYARLDDFRIQRADDRLRSALSEHLDRPDPEYNCTCTTLTTGEHRPDPDCPVHGDRPERDGREDVCRYCYGTGVVDNHPLDSRFDGEPCQNCTAGKLRVEGLRDGHGDEPGGGGDEKICGAEGWAAPIVECTRPAGHEGPHRTDPRSVPLGVEVREWPNRSDRPNDEGGEGMGEAKQYILKRLEEADCIRPSELFSRVDYYSDDTFSAKQVWKAIQEMTARGDLVLGVDNRLHNAGDPSGER